MGVGSPLGDDAAAWAVLRELEARPGGWPGVELYRLEGGQCLLDVLDGRGTLLLVDALAPQGAPGTVRRFEWPDDRLEALRPGSTHAIGPAEALRLAEVLGLLPPCVAVFTIEGAHTEPGRGLSPPVAAAVPALVRLIEADLADHGSPA